MINLFPQDALTLESPLTQAEVAKVFKKYIGEEPVVLNPYKPTEKKFEGTIEGNRFVISKVIEHENSFLPLIKGAYFSKEDKTIIRLEMYLPQSLKIFVGVVWVFLIALGVGFTLQGGERPFNGAIFSILAMAAVLGMTWFGYNKDKKPSLEALKEILQAREVETV